MLKVGIDVGGTFTDAFGLDDSTGSFYSGKQLTTPDDLTRGVLGAIENAGINLSRVDHLIHGSTIAINTLLQRNYYGWWPRAALVTTDGFIDIMEIGRYQRPHMYDAYQQEIEPLIKRRYRFGISEKIDAKGRVIKPLEIEDVRQLANKLRKAGIESVGVVFINSYLNPEHELKAKKILEQELPRIPITTSAETSSKIRELGRVITTAVRTILLPVMEKYIGNLESALNANGFNGKLLLVRSDGGIATAEMGKRMPEVMLLSGPAAGAFSGLNIGKLKDEQNLITQDTGGTSYDVCIIEGGEILQTTEYQLDIDMPIITPLLDIRSIGTGGGSIAWVDSAGSFRVGPQSAGAKPGPACYGFGGIEPTVTDANLILGRIDDTLGGKLNLQKELALQAIEKRIARPLGIDPIKAAEGIINISCNNMARAIGLVTTDRGRDPRNFVPVVFGGAGPMQICFVSDLLEIRKAIVPFSGGVCSAEGAIIMPLKMHHEQTFSMSVSRIDIGALNSVLEKLSKRVATSLIEQGAKARDIQLRRMAEMRYVGQSYEVSVQMPDGKLTRKKMGELVASFHEAHRKEYFVNNPDFEASILNVRVEGTAYISKVTYPTYRIAQYPVHDALKSKRKVFFNDKFGDVSIFDYDKLMPTHYIKGPAVIEMKHSCCVIAPSWQVTIDEFKNLVLEKVERG